MKVPFVDLKAQHDFLKEDLSRSVREVVDQSAFIGGPFLEAFEKDFARFCGTEDAIGVGSGTEALWLALMAAGVGRGDEVITVPNTFIATAEAISLCGAKPVFVDVDERSYTLDPALLEAAVTSKTRAVIPVHLFGQTADMDPIVELAARKGLLVIEDACQAHGAEYKGRRAGSLGHAGCFSFYPSKNLGACGEGGAVTTSDPLLAQTLRRLRDHGQNRKYHHTVIGCNARLDSLQAAILQKKLAHLDAWNAARREHAAAYSGMLGDLDGKTLALPAALPERRHVYHLYAVRAKQRDRFMQALQEKGVGCGIHYPIPIHLQEAYGALGLGPGTFPVTERCAAEFISLPMYPELSREQLEYVGDQVHRAASEIC